MLSNYLWLPILFVIHDFEEIITVPKWVMTHKEQVFSKKRPLFGGVTDGSVLAIGVVEELLILVGVSLYSSYAGTNSLYFYVMIVYTLHLVAHLVFCLQYHTYVPGVVTAVMQLPFLFVSIHQLFLAIEPTLFSVFCNSFLLFCLLLLNVLVLHKTMDKLARRLFLIL
ncbi:HXXEE domain-containing protein [Enterococcus sp. AZ163]|uniref:HXXEE domain-containing protein n=1 Tax=Enterococcus sp. AZ163 TaxID=2774638 RepID=UPI003D2AAB0A